MMLLFVGLFFLAWTSSGGVDLGSDLDLDPDHDNPCLQLLNCTASVETLDLAGELQTAGAVTPAEILDTICSFVTDAHKCVERHWLLCPHNNYIDQAKKTTKVADYICELENRDGMIQILSSDCSMNELRRSLLVADVQGCTESFLAGVQEVMVGMMLKNKIPEPFDFCPVVDEMKMCFFNRATLRCGRQFASFLRHLWTYSLKSDWAENMEDCFLEVQATRNAIDRYFPARSKKP